jgi:cellulose synthase/poly-beta-1,6-N-acetylglucosamine synthase-like glycosyltransferase
MGKKCLEEFNPWPPFVDIFSSTILVLLLFMLILIVNLGYYAQFKFKVSYTGTVATDQLIKESTPRVNKVEILTEQKSVEDQKIVKSSVISQVQEKKELERVGQDLVKVADEKATLQNTIEKENSMLLNFADKEIILDDVITQEVKKFISKMREKFPKHKVIVSSVEPSNQISATVAKQISLARTLNVRNLIRKLRYKKSDVRIRLMDDNFKTDLPQNESGYVLIYIKVNK